MQVNFDDDPTELTPAICRAGVRMSMIKLMACYQLAVREMAKYSEMTDAEIMKA